MDFFDNHCDTIAYLLEHGEKLQQASGQVSFKRTEEIGRWAQVFALFVDDAQTQQTPYERYCALRDTAQRQFALYPHKMQHCRTAQDLDDALQEKRCAAILSVENAAMLEGRLERLEELQQDGIKLLTLTWYAENELGFASKVGGHLKPFGREVVRALPQVQIIPDLSHLSDEGVDDVFSLYDGAVIASHSNARSVTPHFRNVTDAQLAEIIRRNGLVGINFFLPFLHVDGLDELAQIHRHVMYFLERGAQDVLCFGSDFDGIGLDVPHEIGHIGGMPVLYRYLQTQGLSESLLQKIFFENAYRFWHAHLRPPAVK